jgi:formate hydrogenlyase subunit 6/NADH:ubiquinone oxidoreductase subunit I
LCFCIFENVNNTVLYWKNLFATTRSLTTGLRLTLRHLIQSRKSQPIKSIQATDYFAKRDGIATVQYPHVELPVPDVGRYKLHNEIDDCIVCDKCAVVCPVDCITIEPIRSPEVFGKTSDGTSKRIYAATFDIDMAKCCFCGLCTTVCPTECLTMTKEFDFSVPDISQHNFSFADMTAAQITEKKNKWEDHQKAKSAAPSPAATPSAEAESAPKTPKPVFKPKIKPSSPPTE